VEQKRDGITRTKKREDQLANNSVLEWLWAMAERQQYEASYYKIQMKVN
jgi:hypothetical protein